MRSAIRQFAEAMENIMLSHDKAKGDSWQDCDIEVLYEKLQEEYKEIFQQILYSHGIFTTIYVTDKTKFCHELVDFCNVAMMLHTRLSEGG